MSYFANFFNQKVFGKTNLNLWKYSLSDSEFQQLRKEIQYSNMNSLDPRDATLYYAEWWRRCYNGGIPTKLAILESIGGNTCFNFDENNFYKKAKEGAEMLGVKWLVKENTLYFRTLLLQGGLPLNHISKNETHYKKFLLAVLEIQPSSVEDFSLNIEITKYLPKTSRNDFIYKNCFEIVQSILTGETEYDDILESNEVIRGISKELRKRKGTLERKNRETKLHNYWLFDTSKSKISLRLGLSEKYKKQELSSILGFDVESKNYQLYIEDQLICEFSRMLDGNYKTYWQSSLNLEWKGDTQFFDCYVISEKGKRKIKDFVQTMPDLKKPSLWKFYAEKQWILVKGNAVSSERGLLLFPKEWQSHNSSRIEYELYQCEIFSLEFEGEESIHNKERGETRTFRSNVNSFDWLISGQNPSWILKSNITVVKGRPQVFLYDINGEKINAKDYQVFVRHKKYGEWKLFSNISTLAVGYTYLKIEYNGVVAYDKYYNIGDLDIKYYGQDFNRVVICLNNLNFKLTIKEGQWIDIQQNNANYELINKNISKVPKSVKATLCLNLEKSLSIELVSPFSGVALVDSEDNIVAETDKISYQNLYGLRLIKPSDSEVIISFKNSQKHEVTISKKIMEEVQPMISFKSDIIRLFNLEDAMNYKNSVIIELTSGKITKKYEISGFSHTLNTENQLYGRVNIENPNDILDLYAIPLNCSWENIMLLPLHFENNEYHIPKVEFSKQFIIISSKSTIHQLMPRFVNTDENLQYADKDTRIKAYHDKLVDSKFEDPIWKELLAYFNICSEQNLPYSTLDQIRAIRLSSEVSIRAFFYLALHQIDIEEYVRKIIPKLERNLGFCFHWAQKEHWEKILKEDIFPMVGDGCYSMVLEILTKYLNENNLTISSYIMGNNIQAKPILHPELTELRKELGERVLNELPRYHPLIHNKYHIPIDNHHQIKLLIKSPIAVAESIMGKNENCLWKSDEESEIIKKNIQYSQFLVPEFYNSVISWVLSYKQK